MIKRLFTYSSEGKVTSRSQIQLTKKGIEANRECHEWRQILILPISTLVEFDLHPSDLRENILIKDDVHHLASGTLLKIGEVEIRLTFLCEPCKKIKSLVSPKKLICKRGYLGQIITPGKISVNDQVFVQADTFEPIPYEIPERIKWYLDQLEVPIQAAELMKRIGVASSYCRALPNLLKSRPEINSQKILFKTNRRVL